MKTTSSSSPDAILGTVWAACVNLAVEAIANGSFGVGAVIADAKGGIVCSGRNQLFDRRQSGNTIVNSPIAHAELNAFANLPESHRDTTDLVLYTTVEPCAMCTGAIAMSSIKKLQVGTRDPWAGGLHLLGADRFLGHKKIQASFENGIVAEVCFYLNYLGQRRNLSDNDDLNTLLKTAYPECFTRLPQLLESSRALDALSSANTSLFLRSVLELSQ